MTEPIGFPTPVASELTGVSVTSLENWARRGILTPSIASGTRQRGAVRVYSFRDLVALRTIGALQHAGFSVRAIGRVVLYLRKRKGLSASDVLASTMLVTDGHDVYEIDGESRISAFRNAGQAALVLPLGAYVNELEKGARKRAA